GPGQLLDEGDVAFRHLHINRGQAHGCTPILLRRLLASVHQLSRGAPRTNRCENAVCPSSPLPGVPAACYADGGNRPGCREAGGWTVERGARRGAFAGATLHADGVVNAS